MDSHAAGIDAARKRVAAGAAAPAVGSVPRELGDRRRALPPPRPPPRAAEGSRGDVGGNGAAATRDSRRGAGQGKAAKDAGGGTPGTSRGGGASRSGMVALADGDADIAGVADASPGDGTPGVAVVVAPREGRGGDEVGSKRMVSASRRVRPRCGRGADDGGSRLAAAPPRPGLGGSAALLKKPAAHPPRSVVDVGGNGAAATRDSRRGARPGKAAKDAGGGTPGTSRGGGASRSGFVALAGGDADGAGVADASPGDGTPGVAVVVAPREGRGGDEVGSKRMVSASRRVRPRCGRGADDGGSRLAAAPPRPGLGGSAALLKKPAAHPPRSVVDVGGNGAAATRDSRRGARPGKAAKDAGGGTPGTSRGGGASRSGFVALAGGDADGAGVADASPGDGTPGVAVVVAPREGRGGDEVGSKRMVSASRRVRPRCGRGDDDGGLRLVAAPPRPALGGSAGSSAAVVPRPIARGGHHGRDAGALRSPETSRRRSVAAADGFLHTESQGGSGSGGFRSGKSTMDSTIRRFGPGRGRVTASLPLNKSADKRRCNELSTASGFSTHLRMMRVASACTMGSMNKPDDIAASILEDDDFWEKLVKSERKLERKFNVSSDVLSEMYERQHGTQNADAKSKLKMMRQRFQFVRGATVNFVNKRSLKVGRIDLTAAKVIKKLPGFTQHDPIIGSVPGVEIGDKFVFRVELALVGLHRPYRGGIDTIRDGNRVLVAVSIVASGGYPNKLSSSGELVYTGSGGTCAGKKYGENQKLKRGNLGLKNCIQTKTPVRVIHGFKSLSREGIHSRARGASAFTYDGLYRVVDCWREGQAGSKVFKYKLQRIPGQPQLSYCSKTGIMC